MDGAGRPTVQQRTVDALKTVKANNPGIKVYVTFGTGLSQQPWDFTRVFAQYGG
ncbi:hypothetical protein ACWGMA_33175 [Streptomyces asiaticus]